MLKRIIAAGVLASASMPALSDVYLHTFSYHPLKRYFEQPIITSNGQQRIKKIPINQANYGIGYNFDLQGKSYEVGYYFNSEYSHSAYVQRVKQVYSKGSFNAGYAFGVVYGYSTMPLMPSLIGYTEYKNLRLVYVPHPTIPAIGLSVRF